MFQISENVQKVTVQWMLKLVEQQTAMQEVTTFNPGCINTQALKVSKKKVLPFAIISANNNTFKST